MATTAVFTIDARTPRYADVIDAKGNNVSQYTRAQIAAINELHGDFYAAAHASEELQTIDTHWPTSMPLTQAQRDQLTRENSCVACHQDIERHHPEQDADQGSSSGQTLL